jgi:lysophospholipase L1-like esterase
MIKTKISYNFLIILNGVLIIVILCAGYKFRTNIYEMIEPEKSYNIVMFGNSLTAGGQWDAELNRFDIKNSGTKGFTTSHFVWILNGAVLKYNPKICFIEGGINDIGVGIPLTRTCNNYNSIVDTLLKHRIKPILQSTFYVNYPNDSLNVLYNSKVDSLNFYLSTLANKKGITYLNLNQYLSDHGRLRKELNMDGIHINELGYKIWTREVDKILKSKGL